MAGRAVREHGHLPCPSSAQDISVEEAHNLRRVGYLLLKSRGGSRQGAGKVPATVASPAQRHRSSGTVPSPQRTRVSGRLAAFETSPQAVGERTRFLRGAALPSPSSGESGSPAALPFALPRCRQGGRVDAAPFHGCYPKQVQAPPRAVSGDLRLWAAVSEVLIAAALLLQYHFCVLPGFVRTACFPRKKKKCK